MSGSTGTYVLDAAVKKAYDGKRRIDTGCLSEPAWAAAIGEIEMQPDPALTRGKCRREFDVVEGRRLAPVVEQIGADEARHGGVEPGRGIEGFGL